MSDDPDINTPLSKPKSSQPDTQKTFAETTANVSFPKKDQAIIFNTIQDVPQIEYIKAFSSLTPPNNIKFASRVSNNRFCIYFANKNIVEQIIAKQHYITINNTEIPYRRLINPAKRIILSNVQPIIPHDIIAKAINNLSIKMLSPITFMKAGFTNDEFGHIGSFRRQLYIHPEHSDKIPSSILLQFDQTEYRIFLSDDTVTCFSCKQTGHTSNHCKNTPEYIAAPTLGNNPKNIMDTNDQTTQNTDSSPTSMDIPHNDENLKETTTNPPVTQEPPAQEKRSAPSTSSSSCQDTTSIAKTPTDSTPPQTEIVKTRTTNGTLETKLKESAKNPQPPQKKPKRTNSIEQIIMKLDEALLPAKKAFENIPNLKINYNQFKYIIENTLSEPNPSRIVEKFNITTMEMIVIIDTVRPKINNLSIKNRLTRLVNSLLSSLSADPTDTPISQQQ